MRVAVFTLTRQALKLGLKIKGLMPDVDVFGKDWGPGEYATYERGFNQAVREAFYDYDGLVFIMATGIVVRSISPYVSSKLEDPAIVVMDEKGRNIISFLCGHLNGANALTLKLSALLGGNPVITTASDVNETLSVDMIAKNNQLILRDMEGAKNVTSLIVNGFRVAVVSSKPIKEKLPGNMFYVSNREDYTGCIQTHHTDALCPQEDYDGVIFIDSRRIDLIDKPYVNLVPKSIILGIGCRRGTSSERIESAVQQLFREMNLHIDALKSVATIDVKADEAGLINAIARIGVPIRFFSKEEIEPVEELFQQSEFVKETVGVGSVSEAAAYLAGIAEKFEGTQFLVRKRIIDHITLSILEETNETR